MKIYIDMSKASRKGKRLESPIMYFNEVFKRTNSYIKAATIMKRDFNIIIRLDPSNVVG